ncbi:hypothetical protein DFH07DRAFT_813374 [Mycena maculata]|uniref:JmjC domain-containing protein n=1 Tax=Mycena maculata TaxID=230809 RepID=A0AAD7JE31_9AGAR|nr:hypothetical protein DFH07DRAFT_813374 [Mycena maculata]
MSSPSEPQTRPTSIKLSNLLNPMDLPQPHQALKVRTMPPVVPTVYGHSSPDVNYGPAPARTLSDERSRPTEFHHSLDQRVNNSPRSHFPQNVILSAPLPRPQDSISTYLPPMSTYSHERTALSGDYPSYETQYPTSHPHRGSPEIDFSTWQIVERASPRLVARENHSTAFVSNGPGRYNEYPGNLTEQMPSYQEESRPQEVSQKRGVFDVEDAEEPPKSKRKLNAKPRAPPGPNKRSGYTAKKRSEAAQMAALNEEAPTVMYQLVKSSSNDKDDQSYAIVPSEVPDGANVIKEVQAARCMSNRYRCEEAPRCVSCIRRWRSDTCRFQGIRYFCWDSDGNMAGVCFEETPKHNPMNYPDVWNIPLDKSHIQETKRTIAKALLPTLRDELQHVIQDAVVCRLRESEVRATCDTCLTSIFSCSWMCRSCGREACGDCFERVKSLTIEPTGASQSQIEEFQDRRERQVLQSPFFLQCAKKKDHGAKDFSPMTRFSKEELTQAIHDMEQFLRDEGMDVDAAPEPQPWDAGATPSNSSAPYTPADIAPSPLSSDSEATLISNGDTRPADPSASGSSTEVPFHEIQRFKDSDLTEEIFRVLWAKGDPLLVMDVGKKLKINWSPEYLMEKYGSDTCLIVECQTDVTKRITVKEFFSTFGQYEGREECWKLKDWPSSSDFKTEFPDLYEDFSQAVPVPAYVRRDGVLNIASHFPTNTVAPDLGPKMYNANANREVNSKGSTRLHMDMADALNIMTYAAPDPHGGEGSAAWDLFRAQDSEKIRQFLRSKYSLKTDPIHGQTVYLDDDARRELWAEYGVKSYRVYQTVGQAVFIPAGCAHQVRNLSDCIKVAIDFVSPENIQRCEKLTREFREVNHSMLWKEDVLQLRTMMWFAWLSCCRREKLAAF